MGVIFIKKNLLFLFLTLSLFLIACSSTASYKTISIDQVLDYQTKGYVILDVREHDEYFTGHIEDSLNIPLSVLKTGDFSSLDKNVNYIVICRSGNRSKQASEILSNDGFKVLNVSSGISSWTGEIVQ